MKIRGLPGTFAPTYHELQVERRLVPATSFTCAIQAFSASSAGSICLMPCLFRCVTHSVIHSTCCSIEGSILVRTDGLPGPVIMNRFGKPADIRPRYARGPADHFSR